MLRENLVARQVAVAVVDVLEVIHVADRHHSLEVRGIFDQSSQRGLVQQAGQPVQIGALLAFAAQVVQLGAQARECGRSGFRSTWPWRRTPARNAERNR